MIFQECMMGYYGKNCSNQCSAFCNVIGRCDKITGHCDGRCKPGWKGETCDQKISKIQNITYRNILKITIQLCKKMFCYIRINVIKLNLHQEKKKLVLFKKVF